MSNIILSTIYGMIGSLGFAIFFNVNKRHLIQIALGAIIAWVIYLISFYYIEDIFISSAIAAASTTLFSEIIARINKVPSNIILIPSIIPLVPGGDFYNTMISLLREHSAEFSNYGYKTLMAVLGIAIGITMMTFFVSQYFTIINNKKEVNK